MMYRLVVNYADLNSPVARFDFDVQFFGQAQATFAMFAVQEKVTDAALYAIDEKHASMEMLVDQKMFLAAQREQQRQAMLSPGMPPQFRGM